MSSTSSRKPVRAFWLGAWASLFLLLADISYGGYLLELHRFAQAAPIYAAVKARFGTSLAALGFVCLAALAPMSLAGLWLGISGLGRDGFVARLACLTGLMLSAGALWYAASGLLLIYAGMIVLLCSPQAPSVWDKLFAVFFLLLPLTAFIFCHLAGLARKVRTAPQQNDL
ncbi:MAG: hypothetical protein N2491_08700 [Negativicutes bacterium]|nr:hypothetical protein [Negativicutes bacterium]